MRRPIYLDYNATTPCDPAVVEAMAPYWTEHFGNASSNHAYGWAAEEAVKQAREQVAALIGAEPSTLTFTSGATESIALAMLGVGEVYGEQRSHVVVCAAEHKAVLETAKVMARRGFAVSTAPVDPDGVPDVEAIRDLVTEDTALVCVVTANNETGVLSPVRAIADIAHEQGALVLTDATQAVGKIPVDVDELGADLLTLSGHKIYGPKGVGALFVRRRNPRVRLSALIPGAGQQGGLRGGTINVTGLVGLGKAAALSAQDGEREHAHLRALRDRFEAAILDRVPGVHVNSGGAERLPNTANLRFDGLTTAKLLPALRGLAVSTGSACQVKTSTPSHVLTAMGLSPEESFGSLRFSLGRPTTEEEIDAAIEDVVEAVAAVRGQTVPA